MMMKAGVKADVITYSILMNAYALDADVRGAENCFHRMRMSKITPNSYTYYALIRACAAAGKADKTESWFRSMVTQGVQPTQQILAVLRSAVGPRRCHDLEGAKW